MDRHNAHWHFTAQTIAFVSETGSYLGNSSADNGIAFTGQERFRGGVTDTCIGHIFERICKFNGVDKRHTKPYHPWTNGMVERMNRTIKESTIKAYEYKGLEQLREHVQAFVQSYNFGKRLKALRWKTPFRAICEAWEKDPS
ncbi:integrase core domain-containing protein [Delftia tsuruhatensis]|uniref:Integrase core domain-containing protein n=1 Tax=Delftia tsuruhatensis TaxID=180282 RepID=A0AAX3SGU7_9BURK|nr:integrase core domain-containing protein [Delftia tsuruhatensis]WFF79198.1 integrase core domain-containing protein [Delftia tsuruhatensis]